MRSYTLGYIRLFGREEEVVKREVQTITLRSLSALGGSFKLNVTDARGASYSTGKRGKLFFVSFVFFTGNTFSRLVLES